MVEDGDGFGDGIGMRGLVSFDGFNSLLPLLLVLAIRVLHVDLALLAYLFVQLLALLHVPLSRLSTRQHRKLS
ncbi:MAG: hypothetical protein AAF368_19345 [Planctomycetota bacterium]